MPLNVTGQFHDEMVSHTLDLMRFSESVREKIIGVLEDLGEELDQKLTGSTPLTQFQTAKFNQLQSWSSDTISTAYEKNAGILQNQLVDLGDVESNYVPRMVNDVFGTAIMRNGLTGNDVKELVTKSMIQGAPQKDWWAKQEGDLQNRFMQQVRLGVTAGETNDQIVKRIRGTYTGQSKVITNSAGDKQIVPLHTGGIMDISKREATALVRTSVHTVSNNVLMRTYSDNADVVKGVQALATLDARTTPLCRARDKKAWYLPGQGPDAEQPNQPSPANPAGSPPPAKKSTMEPPPFEPPFGKSAAPSEVVGAVNDLEGFANTAITGFQYLPKTVAAEVGNSLAQMDYHFGSAIAPSEIAVEDTTNPLYYATTNINKGKQKISLSKNMFSNGAKIKKALKKDLEAGQLAGDTVGHLISHESAHVLNNKSPAITAKAYKYVKKNFVSVGELGDYAASNVDEAFAEMFATVMNTPPDQLDELAAGFLEQLNEGLAKAGRPTIGG